MSQCVDCFTPMSGTEAQAFLQCHRCRREGLRKPHKLLPRIPTFAGYLLQEDAKQRKKTPWGRRKPRASRAE